MLISDLRVDVRRRLRLFAWDQWAQMGLSSGGPLRSDRWAQDPEALLLFTFEAARTDPRLFDEVLDWLALNERLISSRRLRNLCRGELDRTLVDSALAWTARVRAKNPGDPWISVERELPAHVVFRGLRADPGRADPSFAAHGWLKQPSARSGKSQAPDLFAPINFAFRLRSILGVGARSEVARFLLTVRASNVTAQVVAESAGYAKRNVYEALTLFSSAGVIGSVTVGNEQRYDIDREGWAALLGVSVEDLPSDRSWPQLLYALRRLLRWLEDEQLEDPSPYMQASEARRLAGEITPELRYAGVKIPPSSGKGADYWSDFVELVQAALAALEWALSARSSRLVTDRRGSSIITHDPPAPWKRDDRRSPRR